jgi:hypothetical protein
MIFFNTNKTMKLEIVSLHNFFISWKNFNKNINITLSLFELSWVQYFISIGQQDSSVALSSSLTDLLDPCLYLF